MFKKSSACLVGTCIEVDTSIQAGGAGFSSPTDVGEDPVILRLTENPALLFFIPREAFRVWLIGAKKGEFDV